MKGASPEGRSAFTNPKLSLTTLFDGNFGTDNDGEDLHLQQTLAVAIPIRLMIEQAPTMAGLC
jgi:hypothetical protein